MLGHSTSLENVKDPTKGTLNLVMITGDKVAKLKVDPKRVPKIDMINLHKGISKFLYTDMLQAVKRCSKRRGWKIRLTRPRSGIYR